ADNVCDGNDKVQVGGKTRHVISYLGDFLFPASMARGPVKALSGGERNRLLLARLFARPFNLLVMDEPTNDLDTETLELLEELLLDFSGTLLLVSHDRAFLDNVVTSTLVLEGDERVGEYVGGYSDWLRQRPAAIAAAAERSATTPAPRPRRPTPRRLTYKERHELEALPERVEALEAEQEELHAALAAPDFYRRPGAEIAAARERLERLEQELEAVYERWQELDGVETG
ncbi:MAG: ATP-binding cassette domain-containing protein, partial [bacterium]|nr:ATP-binding cassette domain-containing protein [bacterium]